MGEHSTDSEPTWLRAAQWVVDNRRKLIAGALVALPIVARYVPGFPTDEVVSILRSFLGA